MAYQRISACENLGTFVAIHLPPLLRGSMPKPLVFLQISIKSKSFFTQVAVNFALSMHTSNMNLKVSAARKLISTDRADARFVILSTIFPGPSSTALFVCSHAFFCGNAFSAFRHVLLKILASKLFSTDRADTSFRALIVYFGVAFRDAFRDAFTALHMCRHVRSVGEALTAFQTFLWVRGKCVALKVALELCEGGVSLAAHIARERRGLCLAVLMVTPTTNYSSVKHRHSTVRREYRAGLERVTRGMMM